MKTLLTTLVLSSLLFCSPVMVMAGSGHDHGHSHAPALVDQVTAEKNADEVIASLVERDKIDKSWLILKASSIEKKEFNGRSEWVVTFNNETIADIDKQTLYVFLTPGGEYVAANYTGK